MGAITTAQLSSNWQRITADHADFTFVVSSNARWSPNERTVYYRPITAFDDYAGALHELGHALSGHYDFSQDIILLQMEREAWEKAASLGKKYHTPLDTERIETALDTYRDWLHARSRCPACSGTGIQRTDGQYRCVLCSSQWRANDARQCELRRYLTH